jgi:hypothetical protein
MVGLLCVLAVLGGDLSGIWNGQIVDRNGDPQDVSFRFVQNGSALAGKMYGDNGSFAISAATIVGNQIAFTVTTELNGGISKFVYTGSIEGDEIHLSRERSGNNKPDPKQNIRLKRVA